MPPTPQSNVERYLSVIAGHGGEIPSEPSSRVEYYLDEIVKNGGIGGKLKPKVVASLPATGESGVLYLVSADGSGKNLYNEYVWIEEETRFELLGQTKVDIDLSDYVQNTRKVGGKPLSADVGISVTGTAPIKVTDNGTVSSVAYNISHEDSGVTAGNKGDVTNQTPGFGGTFRVLSVTVDAKGHVTALNDHTTRIPDTEATQSVKGLMSPTDKEKLDTLIDSTLSNSGKAADAKATGDIFALLKELITGIDAPIYRTASGNPATFSDADAANVKALSVTITLTQSGSGNPSPTNIRPITGVSSVTVTRTGKNLLPLPLTRGAIVNGVDEFSFVRLRSGFIPCKPGEPVTLSLVSGTDGVAPYLIYFYDAGKNSVSVSTTMEGVNPFTATAPNNARYCRIVFRKLDNANMVPDDVSAAQLEMNAAATDYEPYQGQSVTVQLTDGADPLTVYGGTLDVTTGTLSVTHVGLIVDGVNIKATNMTKVNAIDAMRVIYPASLPHRGNGAVETWSNYFVADDSLKSGIPFYFFNENGNAIYFKAPSDVTTVEEANAWFAEHPTQVVYGRLHTNPTYQLTPQQLATLSGYNAVSTDATSVSVTYKADTALALGGAV